MKILIIDTDTVISQNLARLFEERGHQTSQVTSAQSALDELDHFGPDVVVMETQLGTHNGIEFIYEMRSHADVDHVPVYIYSTNRNVLDERFAKAWKFAKAQAYYKPSTSQKQLVMQVLKEAS